MLALVLFGLYLFAIECESKNVTRYSKEVLINSTSSLAFDTNKRYETSKKHQARSGKHISSHENCDNIRLYEARGSIASPGYPFGYHNFTSCNWTISNAHNYEITISFDDLDLEEDSACKHPYVEETKDCCTSSWVKITTIDGRSERKYCGKSEDNRDILKSFINKSGYVTITFHASNSSLSHRGFHLTYSVTPSRSLNNSSVECKSDEFRCTNGKCILNRWRCNRRNECEDNSDEEKCDDICVSANEVKCNAESLDNVPGCYSFPFQRCNDVWDCSNGEDEKGCGGCPKAMFLCPTENLCYSEVKRCDGEVDCRDFHDELNCGLCGPNKTQCSPDSLTECYEPVTQRCDHIFQCRNGVDESGCTSGCKNKILCVSGMGCFTMDQRCNGFPDCIDYSDEENCTADLCRAEHGNFLCANGNCIRKAWTCDKSDDCGDSSDELGEANCLKNSVITAALMGSLICGLLLVIAISCTCKLIALRQAEQRQEFSETQSQNSNSIYVSQQYPRFYPFRETQLFGVEHDAFFREPPPSYSASVGVSDTSVEQQRRRRRERRNRRRPPVPPVSSQSERTENVTVAAPAYSVDSIITSNDEQQSTSSVMAENKIAEQSNDKSSNVSGDDTGIEETSSTTAINIELDNIPSLSPLDCDQQPLLS